MTAIDDNQVVKITGQIVDVEPAPGYPDGYAVLVIRPINAWNNVERVVVSPQRLAEMRRFAVRVTV